MRYNMRFKRERSVRRGESRRKKTWCQLSEKEAARRNPDGKTPTCQDAYCFDCYGDRTL